jgi:hypothetical protein
LGVLTYFLSRFNKITRLDCPPRVSYAIDVYIVECGFCNGIYQVGVKKLAYIFMSFKNQTETMKRGLFLVVFSIFLAMPVFAELWTGGATVIEDAFVMNWTGVENDTNYGANADLRLDGNVVGGIDSIIRRFFMKFNVTAIPNGSVIESANLYLWQTGGTGAGLVTEVHEVTNDTWNEDTITWSDNPMGKNWTDIVYPSGVNSTIQDSQNTGTGTGWYEFDVTDLLQRAKNNGLTNMSIFIGQDDVPAVQEQRTYASSEHGTPALRPVLNATYDPPATVQVDVIDNEVYIDQSLSNCRVAITDATVTFGDQSLTNATYWDATSCYHNGSYVGAYRYRFYNVSYGEYALTVQKSGYNTHNQTWTVNEPYEEPLVVLSSNILASIVVRVSNSTDVIIGALVRLYDSDGLNSWDYTDTAGVASWSLYPNDTYYFTVERQHHVGYVSQPFYHAQYDEFDVQLEPTTVTMVLSAERDNISYSDYANFTIATTNLAIPQYNCEVDIVDSENTVRFTPLTLTTATQEFQLYGGTWFTDGINCVWLKCGDYVSNVVCFEMSETVDIGDIDSPMVDFTPYGSGLSFLSAIFQPFVIIFGAMTGVSGMLEARMRTKGSAFFSLMIIGSMVGSYIGLFPLSVGIGTIIICAFMLAKFVLHII